MQPLYMIFTFLSSLCFLSSVLCIQCNKTQYPWPMETSKLCCKKCLPGERMNWRSEHSCTIDCKPCPNNQYRDSYNVEMSCNMCSACKKQYMILKSPCNSTHDAVCACKDGYTCKDQSCTQCVPVPATNKPTPIILPSTTSSTTEQQHSTTRGPYKPVRDTVWFFVITALLVAGITLVVVTKIKPFLQWIRSKHGYFLTVKPAPVPQFAEDEDVSKPVQEVCGKCDQPIDV